MIVSFFSRGTGGGSGPVDYLVGKERNRDKAEVLAGDVDETVALIDSSPYTKKYTSGVLSFEEAGITEEQKREVMKSFEECLFPSLDNDQYNVLWVEHADKGRVELNFVIPNIELTTGKRLQPYYHAADGKRVDAWRTIQNLTHGFSDPFKKPWGLNNINLQPDLRIFYIETNRTRDVIPALFEHLWITSKKLKSN